MSKKKLLSRGEFEKTRIESAAEMAADTGLREDALGVLERADRYHWIHQTNWLGEPILNVPQDMFGIQEAVFKSRPRFIIEVGVAWGGAMLFYSTLMEVLGGEKVIGVDIYLPDDLQNRLASHGRLSERLVLVEGSSVEPDTFQKVKSIVQDCRDVMVILDSNHTHDHVLKELQLYSSLVGKGHYMICGDTIIEHMPVQSRRSRPWGPGNSPETALRKFLTGTDRFEADVEIENKLLLTCNAGGYLRCRSD